MQSKWIIACTFLLALPAHAGEVLYSIRVDGITCPFCVATSVRALKKIDGVREVASDLESGTIFVCADERVELTNPQLSKLFRDKGFTYRSYEKSASCTSALSRVGNELDGHPEEHGQHDDAGH